MKRYIPVVFLVIGLFVIMVLAGLSTHNAQALPEYSAQVGEPCSSCHISPSGGGPRGPRGQAWSPWIFLVSILKWIPINLLLHRLRLSLPIH
jgi:hypothetical protein